MDVRVKGKGLGFQGQKHVGIGLDFLSQKVKEVVLKEMNWNF